jgi:Ricin-type beta-trefoil lectin domain-like
MPLPIPDGVYYIFSYAGPEDVYALDVPIGDPDQSFADHTPVQVFPWNRGDNQKWQLHNVEDDIYTIVNMRSGKALDVPDGSPNPTPIQQFHYFNGDQQHPNQLWKFEFVPGVEGPEGAAPSSYWISTLGPNGLALDLPNGDTKSGNWVQVYTPHPEFPPGFSQRWMLRRPDNGGLIGA